MTNRELIDFCKTRTSEICNQCEHFGECDTFIRKTGHVPFIARNADYTDEVIEDDKLRMDTKSGR